MSVQITGLDDLMAFLTTAPETIRAQAMELVQQTTEAAAADIARAYPSAGPHTTGNLQRRVTTRYPASAALLGVVLSAAPHAHLYEFGTERRQNRTGANRGRMPARPVVPLVAARHRQQLFRNLRDLLTRLGFVVEA